MCTHYRNSPCLSSILMYVEIYHPYSWYIINYGINAFFPSSIYVYQVVWANTTTSTLSIFYGIQYYVASFLHHRCLTFLTYNGYRTHFRPNIGRKINSGIFFIIYKYEWYFMYDMSDICCIKRIVYACRYFMRYTGLVNVWMWVCRYLEFIAQSHLIERNKTVGH